MTVLAKITSRSQIMTKKSNYFLLSHSHWLPNPVTLSFHFCHNEMVKIKLCIMIEYKRHNSCFGSFTLFLLENLVCRSFFFFSFFFGQMNLILNAVDFSGKSLANLVHFQAKCPFFIVFYDMKCKYCVLRKKFLL